MVPEIPACTVKSVGHLFCPDGLATCSRDHTCTARSVSALLLWPVVDGRFDALLLGATMGGRANRLRGSDPHLLWGDGEHDDTAALDAWFRGETVIWAKTHQPVGEEIVDRSFLLRSAIYVTSGSRRKLKRFRMVWPERNEIVTGGMIHSGNDPAQPPMADGVVMVGGDNDGGHTLRDPAARAPRARHSAPTA